MQLDIEELSDRSREAQPRGPAVHAETILAPTHTGDSIRVPAERLDDLMDQVGELVIA